MMRRTWWILGLAAGCGPKIDRGPAAADHAEAPVRVLERRDNASPNIYLQAMIAAGSATDPIGKEGLAALTAVSLTEAGAGSRSGTELKDALYPLGAAIDEVVDREWVTVRMTCHRDHAAACLELFTDILTAPRFDDADVVRARDAAVYGVTDGLLASEEQLAFEAFNTWVYEGRPYGHPVEGRAGALPTLTSEDVRAYYASHYVRESVVVGVAGAYDDAWKAKLDERLAALPGKVAPELVLAEPVAVEGRSLLALDTETPVTGYYFGVPYNMDRADPDYAALYLAFTALGEHRQSHGHLFRTLRTDRGLNYGDYAYMEPYVQRGGASMPEQGTARKQGLMYFWLRPTGVENGAFALKLALDEIDTFVANGLTDQEFADMQRYAIARLPLFATDPGRRLAYALEAAATGQPDPIDDLPAKLQALTREQVNAALKRHVSTQNLKIVAVSGEADALVRAIVEGTPTPIVYADGIEPDAAQTARDAAVAAKVLGIPADHARSAPAQGIFR